MQYHTPRAGHTLLREPALKSAKSCFLPLPGVRSPHYTYHRKTRPRRIFLDRARHHRPNCRQGFLFQNLWLVLARLSRRPQRGLYDFPGRRTRCRRRLHTSSRPTLSRCSATLEPVCRRRKRRRFGRSRDPARRHSFGARQPGTPAHWLAYFTVSDCAAAATAARNLGAKLYLPPTDFEDVGRISVMADPQGATFAIFKAAARGVGVS
jgi:hypothetical protein